MTRTMVRCIDVCKNYRRKAETVEVLAGIDLEIAAGEFVAMMGPSGSGKTTLLNLIGGLDRPGSGEVEVAKLRLDRAKGRALAAWRAENLGFIFQFYNLLPVLTAEQNVELPLLLTNLSARERKQRVALALEVVGLPDRGRHKPRELSGGQQQRVAIARAIVADPGLLICDEPTGDLDRNAANEILTLLQRLNREQGKTIIMVTHDPRAAHYASRVLVMDKGRLRASESAEEAS